MKNTLLGQFKTDENGQLVITDPCYELSNKVNHHIKVKPGTYNSYLSYGKLKDPIFDWDKFPGNYRNSELVILNVDYPREPVFKKTRKSICVDSGQAGFFNASTYGNPLPEEIVLANHITSFLKESIINDLAECRRNRTMLRHYKTDKYFNEYFQKMKTCFENSEEKTIAYFNHGIKFKLDLIKEKRNWLKSGTRPSYLKEKKSKDFYEIQCDLTKGRVDAGVSLYGTVARSGEGDGSYLLYLAYNNKKEIIGAKIKFITSKRLK